MIESIKTKAELLIEINNLKKQINDNNELLADIGLIQRDTFLTRIEVIEENTLKKIENLITDCVNETGREFPWILVEQKIFSNFNSN